jgi:hypothetical protein
MSGPHGGYYLRLEACLANALDVLQLLAEGRALASRAKLAAASAELLAAVRLRADPAFAWGEVKVGDPVVCIGCGRPYVGEHACGVER